jgi:hypothetical protein
MSFNICRGTLGSLAMFTLSAVANRTRLLMLCSLKTLMLKPQSRVVLPLSA